MDLTDLKVPNFPESVTDGTLVAWHKKPGDSVQVDEVIAEIETDKVVFEVPAVEAGVLTEVLVEEGATVLAEQVLGRIDTTAAAVQEVKAKTGMIGRVASGGESNVTPLRGRSSEKLVTPSAEKLIAENNLDSSHIQGTGKDGRVLKEDVQSYLEKTSGAGSQAGTESNAVTTETTGSRTEKRVPMSRLRARIAERLVESQHTAAILTTFNEINMQPVMDLRQRYRDSFEQQHGVKLGFMSFFVKAVVEALKRFPDVNASVEDSDIIYHGYFDIGIAVGSPRGLVVPVLRDADQKSFAEIEKNIRDFGDRAQTGSLSLDEITGGTFSISNGGVFGSLLSTPIINPPQSGILGMHKIEKRPVVENDEIVIRPMMYLALSYDHRLVDGRGAVQFLVAIKELLEDPSRLLLEI